MLSVDAQLANSDNRAKTIHMKLAIPTILAIVLVTFATAAISQTRSVRDTATAYGARLTAKGLPAEGNANRVNSRARSRIDNRLSLRIERYRFNVAPDSKTVFQTSQSNGVRTAPVIVPQPDADQ